MKIEYDREADSAYVYFDESTGPEQFGKTVPIDPGEIDGMINLDFGRDGRLIGMEVLDASRFLLPKLLSEATY